MTMATASFMITMTMMIIFYTIYRLHCLVYYILDFSKIVGCLRGEVEKLNLVGWFYFLFQNRYKLQNGSFVVEAVEHMRHQRSDQGDYQCMATSPSQGTIISRKAKLQVACKFSVFKMCIQLFQNFQYYIF